VLDQNGKLSGVLALQLSIKKLNQVMQVTAGMGDTGETYHVGPDLTMRSDSRFYSTSSILKTKVDTIPVQMAMNGENSVIIADDYRGVSVYSAFKSIDVLGETWAILAEIDESEVHQPIHSLNSFLYLAGFIIGLLIAALGYFLSNDLANPIRSMTKAMNRLSKNDLSTNISVDERRDEVGLMAKALVEFKKFALEREQLQKHLSHMSKHDSLTGLPNREFIMPYLKEKTDRDNLDNTGITVMYADLDGFKGVNDSHGHAAGDAILKQVSEQLKQCLREEDIVARMGGDEFLITLSKKTSIADCQKIADKIIKNISTIHVVGDQLISIGVSLGSATFPEDGIDTRELLQKADQAMYAAKANGKNCYVPYNEQTLIAL
jgi:diguanylate cyclase (GGDEF)-like protein